MQPNRRGLAAGFGEIKNSLDSATRNKIQPERVALESVPLRNQMKALILQVFYQPEGVRATRH